jgi:hypothetical protein
MEGMLLTQKYLISDFGWVKTLVIKNVWKLW